MHPQIRISADPRLSPIIGIINHTYKYCRTKQRPVNLWRLLQTMDEYASLSSVDLYNLLEFLELIKRPKKGNITFVIPNKNKATSILHKLKALQLLFWAVSSQWYPQGKIVQMNEHKTKSILQEYNFNPDHYQGLMVALKITNYFKRLPGKGGVRIIHPGKLNMDHAFSRDHMIRITGKKTDQTVSQKANMHLLRPMTRKVKAEDINNEKDFKGIALKLFENHGKSKKQVGQIQSFKIDKDDPTRHVEYKDWRIIDEPTTKKRGEWRYPDILGYRISSNDYQIVPEMEVLAVELKYVKTIDIQKEKTLKLEWIRQAESNFDFTNIAYLMINVTLDQIKLNKRNFAHLVKSGLGLIVQQSEGNYYRWIEALPPVYQLQRAAQTSRILHEYLGENQKDEIIKATGNENIRHLG